VGIYLTLLATNWFIPFIIWYNICIDIMISERWPPTFGPCNVQREKNSDVTVFSLFCLERTLHETHETRPVRPAVVKHLLSAGFVPAAAAAASRCTNTFNLAVGHTHYNVTETDPSSGPPALYVLPCSLSVTIAAYLAHSQTSLS